MQITLECDPANLPCDERNLVVRVARAWYRDHAGSAGVIAARLTKRTPVGAGLGGGSANAARMVLALDRLLPVRDGGRSAGELSSFAARFGSDVPFFLAGPSSICAGQGRNRPPHRQAPAPVGGVGVAERDDAHARGIPAF